jgi:hypothetical protein
MFGVALTHHILSHHDFDIDAEIVYEVCVERIPELAE